MSLQHRNSLECPVFCNGPDMLPVPRRKKKLSRRAQSAAEFSPSALSKARGLLKKSFSSETPEDVRSLHSSASSLTKLFSRSSPKSSRANSIDLHSQISVTPVTSTTRYGGRYQYTALESDSNSHEKMEMERKARERAENACLYYLKCQPRYSLLEHLNDIGSRVEKHWFVVRDCSMKTERLLTLVPPTTNCPIDCDPHTRQTILDLFLALQHPYIYPILDLEFIETAPDKQVYVTLVIPFNCEGSLKDLIYKSCWHDEWGDKYSSCSEGLPISQVQRLGRQILEALLFLKERGFPHCTHLHSGNIILQNGVARLSGLENTLLGFTSRIHPIICGNQTATTDPRTIDVICFGHVLFEMCAGYELTSPEPNRTNLIDINSYPQVVKVLEYIFYNSQKIVPSIEELLLHDFFRNLDLREMRATSIPQFQAQLTLSALNLLNSVKRYQKTFLEKGGSSTDRQKSSDVKQNSSSQLREREKNCAFIRHQSSSLEKHRYDDAEILLDKSINYTRFSNHCDGLIDHFAPMHDNFIDWETRVQSSDDERYDCESEDGTQCTRIGREDVDADYNSNTDEEYTMCQEHRSLSLHLLKDQSCPTLCTMDSTGSVR